MEGTVAVDKLWWWWLFFALVPKSVLCTILNLDMMSKNLRKPCQETLAGERTFIVDLKLGIGASRVQKASGP